MSQSGLSQPLTLRISLFTSKEGLFSRAAHDLQLHVERVSAFLVNSKELTIEADPSSIVVEGAMRNGLLQPDQLSLGNRREIEQNIQERVLQTSRYPRLQFEGLLQDSAGSVNISGELEICGVRRRLEITATQSGGELVAEFEVRPSDFGIQPFRALMGAIRLQDRVVIKVRGTAT